MTSLHCHIYRPRPMMGIAGVITLCTALGYGCIPLEPLPDETSTPGQGGQAGASTSYLEAEDATLFGAVKEAAKGAKGSGAVRFEEGGDFVEFDINVSRAAMYEFTARYANGTGQMAPLQVMVNSTATPEPLEFKPTGDWETWDLLVWQMKLKAGANTVRLQLRQSGRGPNLDSLAVQKASAEVDSGTPNPDPSDAGVNEVDATPAPKPTEKADAGDKDDNDNEEPSDAGAPPKDPVVVKPPPPPTPMCNGVDVFAERCIACHEAGGIGHLDLRPEGLFDRIMNTKVVSGRCVGQDHVSSELDAQGSPTGAFMARLTGTSCGTRMPLGPSLSKADIACVADWLAANLKP